MNWFKSKLRGKSVSDDIGSRADKKSNSAYTKFLSKDKQQQYIRGEALPPDFHMQVVDLEIKGDRGELTHQQTRKLMELYSNAIEFYNLNTDLENQVYYQEKLTKLNDQTKTKIDRQIVKSNKDRSRQQFQQSRKDSGQLPPQSDRDIQIQPSKKSNIVELRRREDAMKLNLYNQEIKQNKDNIKEKTIEESIMAQKKTEKTVVSDMQKQKDSLQQRLAARKKSMRVTNPRAISCAPGSLSNSMSSLNFGPVSSHRLQDGSVQMKSGDNDNNVKNLNNSSSQASLSNYINAASPQKKMIKSSRMSSGSFTQANLRKFVDAQNKNQLNESYNSGRSTTTAGGALGNKIGLAVSRIIGNTSAVNINDEDEIQELIQLIQELNQHQDLTIRLTNQTKLCRILDNKDTKKEKNKVKVSTEMRNSLGGGFQSKLKLEMKGIQVDPEAKAIMEKVREDLLSLQNQKDEATEEFQEEHAESKFTSIQAVKKKYRVKIAMAQKKKEEEKVQELESQQKDEVVAVEEKLKQLAESRKNEIKEEFNEKAQDISIDAAKFVHSLIKTRGQVSNLVKSNSGVEEETKDGTSNLQEPSLKYNKSSENAEQQQKSAYLNQFISQEKNASMEQQTPVEQQTITTNDQTPPSVE